MAQNGYFSLGEALFGGGIDREGAYLEGLDTGSQINYRRAQTTNALAQARQRQQKAQATEKLGDALESMGLDRGMAPILQAEAGGDFKDLMTGRETQQGMDFRDILANPELSPAERQGAGLALRGDPITQGDVFGPGGEQILPDLFEGTFNPQVTATGQAQIGADEALGDQRLAAAGLSDARAGRVPALIEADNALAYQRGTAGDLNQAKIDRPEDYFKAGSTVNVNTPLSEAVLPGGEGQSIVSPGINAEEALGAEAVVKSGINSLVDFFGGGTPFVDNAVAQNTLAELSARTQIAMRADVPGGRPPVMVQELLARYAEDPAQLFRGDELGRINLQTTLESLRRSRDRARQMLDSPTKKTPTRQGALEESYLNLSDTIADYEMILDSLNRAAGIGAEADTQPDAEGWQTAPNGVRYRVKQ